MDRSEDFVRVLHQTRPIRVARFAVTNKFTGQLQLSGLELINGLDMIQACLR